MGGVLVRGQIENRGRKQQIIDFSGLRFGTITPTDIDGVIEYRGKAFIYYEFKYQDAPVKRGQQVAFEEAVISHLQAGRKAIVMILEHDIHDCKDDIQAANCRVREFYLVPEKGWVKPKANETAHSLTQKFFEEVEKKVRSGVD